MNELFIGIIFILLILIAYLYVSRQNSCMENYYEESTFNEYTDCVNPQIEIEDECVRLEDGKLVKKQNEIFNDKRCKTRQIVTACSEQELKQINDLCINPNSELFCKNPFESIRFCASRNLPLLNTQEYINLMNNCKDKNEDITRFNLFLENQKLVYDPPMSCEACQDYSQFCKNLDKCIDCDNTNEHFIKAQQCPQWYPESEKFWIEMNRKYPQHFEKTKYITEVVQKNKGKPTSEISTGDYNGKSVVVTNLTSPNKQFQLYIDTQGNLSVLDTINKKIKWSSKGLWNTKRVSSPYRVVFQKDGDLLIVGSKTRPLSFKASNTPQWTFTKGQAPYLLTLDNNGGITITDANRLVLWFSS